MGKPIIHHGVPGIFYPRTFSGTIRNGIVLIMIVSINAGFAWYCVYLAPAIVKNYWLTGDREYLYPWPFLLAVGGLCVYLLYVTIKYLRKEFVLLSDGIFMRDLLSSRFHRWKDIDDIIRVVTVINGIGLKPYYEARLFKSRKKIRFDITTADYEELAAGIKAYSHTFGPVQEYRERHLG